MSRSIDPEIADAPGRDAEIPTSERLRRLVEEARREAERDPGAPVDSGPDPAAEDGAADDGTGAGAGARGRTVSLGWILERIHERAFGLFLLVLALPCCVPFLYGVPQIVALPMLAVTAQMLAGRRAPWLPARLAARRVSEESHARMVSRAEPWLRALEAVSRPRLSALTRPPLDRLTALALTLFAASILVPLPGTNTVPGIAVAIAAIGLLERDGLLVLGGATLGGAWIAVLIGAGTWIASMLLGA